jgi:putative flippase GtrA
VNKTQDCNASTVFWLVNSPRFSRLSKFALVGLAGTLTYYVLLFIFVEWLLLPVLVSTSIAFPLVVLQQYLLHHTWTFQSTKRHIHSMPAYFLMTATGFCINLCIMYIGVDMLGFYYAAVQFIAIASVTTWNFMVSNLVIFRDVKSARPPYRTPRE